MRSIDFMLPVDRKIGDLASGGARLKRRADGEVSPAQRMRVCPDAAARWRSLCCERVISERQPKAPPHKYRGRPEDKKRNTAIMNMLRLGMSWNSIIEAASGSGKQLSRATLSKLAKRVREAA